jgi:hypothetical protein
MLRQLFALLLLLTGLAALGQPAQARAYEGGSAGLAAAAEYVSPVRPDPRQASLPAPARAVESRTGIARSLFAVPMAAPTVRVQADRAHE